MRSEQNPIINAASGRNNGESKVENQSAKALGKRKTVKKFDGVLTTAEGQGGLDSGIGHDFQSRYIVCHIPQWLADPNFTQLIHEGSGDVDVRYGGQTPETRRHFQVKNYTITLRMFKDIVANFSNVDAKMSGVYQKFILACPEVNADMQPLVRAIKRIREASPFYDTATHALSSDESALQQRLQKMGLAQYADLILKKVDFHLDLHNFRDGKSSQELFAGRLQQNAVYRDRLGAVAAQNAYQALFAEVRDRVGETLDRAFLESIIDRAARDEKPLGEPALHLVVQNWTPEKFDFSPDNILDWSQHFDRDTQPRRVPSPATWRDELLPSLGKLRDELRARPARLIRLRGKCCLSTGIALGQTFSQVAGWHFEIPQPPLPGAWRSDVSVERSYPARAQQKSSDSIEFDPHSDAIALVVSVRRDSTRNAENYLAAQSVRVRALLTLEPANGKGALSVDDAHEAVSLALAVRQEIDRAQDTYGTSLTHLFYNGPFALAVFIGQQLNAVGEVQLYEYTDPNYTASCRLRT